MDGELSGWMGTLFNNWGLTVHFGSTAESIEARGEGLESEANI